MANFPDSGHLNPDFGMLGKVEPGNGSENSSNWWSEIHFNRTMVWSALYMEAKCMCWVIEQVRLIILTSYSSLVMPGKGLCRFGY